MKKKLVAMFLVLVVTVCLLPTAAFADYNPYLDEVYYKENQPAGQMGGTGGRNKTTTSKVYVVPSSSPSGVTLVQTVCYVGGSPTYKNVNGTVSLYSGTKYGITNRVYEDGDKSGTYVYMWLGVAPSNVSGSVSGVWSPDWTGSGNVSIV